MLDALAGRIAAEAGELTDALSRCHQALRSGLAHYCTQPVLAAVVESAAVALQRAGRPQDAARLLGAAGAWRGELPRLVPEEEDVQHTADTLRAELNGASDDDLHGGTRDGLRGGIRDGLHEDTEGGLHQLHQAVEGGGLHEGIWDDTRGGTVGGPRSDTVGGTHGDMAGDLRGGVYEALYAEERASPRRGRHAPGTAPRRC